MSFTIPFTVAGEQTFSNAVQVALTYVRGEKPQLRAKMINDVCVEILFCWKGFTARVYRMEEHSGYWVYQAVSPGCNRVARKGTVAVFQEHITGRLVFDHK